MHPETTELRLIGYLTESTWTQRSKSSSLTPKTQLEDILTKGNFTRDEWNHLLHLFNSRNFSCASGPQTMSIILYNTVPAVCIEKVVIRKSGEELYNKTYQSPISPQRIVLKPNLHYERQDTTSFDARTSIDQSTGEKYRETCRGEIDFRIQGLLHSTVQQQDHTRKAAVQKLIHHCATHPNREALKADLKQNHAFNPFSEQSKDMIYSMGNMEYFEMFEITPKVQCQHCMTYWTKGIVHCTCGTCLRPSDKTPP